MSAHIENIDYRKKGYKLFKAVIYIMLVVLTLVLIYKANGNSIPLNP